jgi:hypothetical protein
MISRISHCRIQEERNTGSNGDCMEEVSFPGADHEASPLSLVGGRGSRLRRIWTLSCHTTASSCSWPPTSAPGTSPPWTAASSIPPAEAGRGMARCRTTNRSSLHRLAFACWGTSLEPQFEPGIVEQIMPEATWV